MGYRTLDEIAALKAENERLAGCVRERDTLLAVRKASPYALARRVKRVAEWTAAVCGVLFLLACTAGIACVVRWDWQHGQWAAIVGGIALLWGFACIPAQGIASDYAGGAQ